MAAEWNVLHSINLPMNIHFTTTVFPPPSIFLCLSKTRFKGAESKMWQLVPVHLKVSITALLNLGSGYFLCPHPQFNNHTT